MTQDALDELRQLSNVDHAAATQAQADAFRPRSRSPLMNFEADVKVSMADRSGSRQDGTEWSNRVAVLHLSNLVVQRSFEPVNSTSADIDVPVSERQVSQMGLMVQSANILDPTFTSFADFNGSHIRVEETVKQSGTRKFKRGDGTEGEGPMNIFYYKVVELKRAGAKANGAAAPNPQSVEAALAYLVGKDEVSFTKDVLPYLASAGLSDLPTQMLIANKKFVSLMVETGKASQLPDGTYALV